MSDSASPSPAAPLSRSRRRRRKSAAGSRLWIVLGVLVGGAGVFFGAKIWLRNYLQSDKFRQWVSAEASRRLQAEVKLDDIRWQDSSASVGSFMAEGSADSPFAKLEARDIRATVNAGAIWDRVWQVDEIKVSRVFLDLSAGQRSSKLPPAPDSGSADSGKSSGFLSSILPNRTVVKGIDVEQLGFQWQSGEKKAEARGIGLHIKPAETNEFFLASGHRGTVTLSQMPNMPVALRDFEASLQGQEVTLDSLNAEAAGADIAAEGAVFMGDKPSLDLKADVSGLDLEKCLPEDWIKRLKGKAGGKVKVNGDPRQFDRLQWRGNVWLRDGLLEGLPLLQVIARKTRNEAFVRLLLKEARTDFTRTSDGGWLLEKLVIDAPGLLRLKGYATAAADGALHGEMLLGIVPGTLRYLAGAEQSVFLPLNQLVVTQRERALITPEDSGLLWTRMQLRGTLAHPQEDLADRLAKAWFNATVDEVLNMSMEGAIKAAETASKAASEAAGLVVEKAPELIENGLKTGGELIEKGIDGGGGLIEKGVDGGLKVIDGLLPGGR